MYQYTAYTPQFQIDSIMDYLAVNWAMAAMISAAVIAFGAALYFAIRERIQTGSTRGLKTIVLLPFLLFAGVYAFAGIAVSLISGIQAGNPYAIAVRMALAVILPAIFFGYTFAIASNILVATAHIERPGKYAEHFTTFLSGLVGLGSIYWWTVRPVIDGLSPLFLWLGLFTGWMLAPAIISRGWAGFDEHVKIKIKQLNSNAEQ
ncbi:MAG: hypothetical protein ACYC0V_14550 [Armatimonadota bacterium]